jgi:tRNA modification GTPase
MNHSENTIAAISTANGTAAISMIRISGSNAFSIAEKFINKPLSLGKARTSSLCKIHNADGELIDEVLLTPFFAPHSYTGENVVEISGHGGTLITRSLLDRILQCGARLAEPGEFTQQAFLNGKLDLTQAESIMDLIAAQSKFAIRAAHEQREGHLGQRTEFLRNELLECLAHLEAYIDFPEEDISPEVGNLLTARLTNVATNIDQLLATSDRGRFLREGVRTVIFGEPNTGKSSLLNRLLGYDRAIVSDIAGTTRDTLEEIVTIGDIALRLIDTAGIRDQIFDKIEQEGIRRSSLQASRADLILSIFDASQPKPTTFADELISHQQTIRILNKCDLYKHPTWNHFDAIELSCTTGEGIDQLEKAIISKIIQSDFDQGDSLISINVRHQDCLRRAVEFLSNALEEIKQSIQPELVCVDIRSAMDALGEIAGKIDTEDLLGVIFSRFCIGK